MAWERKPTEPLTVDEARRRFHYDPESGRLTWRIAIGNGKCRRHPREALDAGLELDIDFSRDDDGPPVLDVEARRWVGRRISGDKE